MARDVKQVIAEAQEVSRGLAVSVLNRQAKREAQRVHRYWLRVEGAIAECQASDSTEVRLLERMLRDISDEMWCDMRKLDPSMNDIPF